MPSTLFLFVNSKKMLPLQKESRIDTLNFSEKWEFLTFLKIKKNNKN